MCSETSEVVGTIWEHAQKEFQKFLKIRITLLHEEELYKCDICEKTFADERYLKIHMDTYQAHRLLTSGLKAHKVVHASLGSRFGQQDLYFPLSLKS